MKEIPMSEVKQIGLQTLCYFDAFYRQHDLKYYLAYGSLLGAIRHQGYIPWDDDIDVWMFREDYQRLIALNQEIDQTQYLLNCIECNESFVVPFAKLTRTDTVIYPTRYVTGYLYGLSIDIFPLDVIGDYTDEKEARQCLLSVRNKHLAVLNKYHHTTGGKEEKWFKKLAKKAVYFYASKKYGSLSERIKDYAQALMTSFPEASGQYVTTIDGTTVFRKDWFDRIIEVQFEDHHLFAPAFYDEILRQRYGDYMAFPPKEQQVIPHTYKAYYLD